MGAYILRPHVFPITPVASCAARLTDQFIHAWVANFYILGVCCI
jgi:hypothetical protein